MSDQSFQRIIILKLIQKSVCAIKTLCEKDVSNVKVFRTTSGLGSSIPSALDPSHVSGVSLRKSSGLQDLRCCMIAFCPSSLTLQWSLQHLYTVFPGSSFACLAIILFIFAVAKSCKYLSTFFVWSSGKNPLRALVPNQDT